MDEPMTQAEALDWLAALEKDCYICGGRGKVLCGDGWSGCNNCNGKGKAPVLDLREPCQDGECQRTGGVVQWTGAPYHAEGMTAYAPHEDCGGRSWQPKQGETALHQVMHNDGWSMEIIWVVEAQEERISDGTSAMAAGERCVTFWRNTPYYFIGEDANDWLAALKAMQAAGYGVGDDGRP